MIRSKRFFWLKLWVLPFILLLALAACGGDDDNNDNGGDLEAVGSSNRARPAATSEGEDSALDEAPALSLADASGQLLFIQGESLYHLSLADPEAEPALLVEDINTDLISLSPDNRHLLYSPRAASLGSLRMLSVDNLEGQELRELGRGRDWRVQGWSPDGQWAVVRVSGERAELVDTATGELHTAEVNFDFFQPTWLQDGRVLFPHEEFTPDGSVLHEVAIYDPASGEWQRFEEDLPPPSAEGPGGTVLQVFLEEQGLEAIRNPRPPYWYQPPEDFFSGGAEICDSWHIIDLSSDDREQVYTADGVFKFSELTQLDEDGLLFLEWRLADCERSGAAEVQLVHLMVGEGAEVLAGNIFPGIANFVEQTPGGAFGAADLPPYVLSPEQQYVAWVSGSLAERQGSLHARDLDSGSETVLLEAPGSSTDAEFIQDNGIRAVYWLAP